MTNNRCTDRTQRRRKRAAKYRYAAKRALINGDGTLSVHGSASKVFWKEWDATLNENKSYEPEGFCLGFCFLAAMALTGDA